MKPWILFACLSLAGCAATAQQPPEQLPQHTTYGHFKIDGQELIWQHVVDTTLRAEDVLTFYRHLSRVSDVALDGTSVLASFDMLTFDGNRYGGMNFGHWATVGSQPVLAGRLKVDLKGDRYRMTLYDLRFVGGETECTRTYQSATQLLLMREGRTIKPTVAVPNVLGVYDRFFQEYFSVHPSAKEADF